MAEEKKNIKFGQIGNALRSAASDHVTAVASDIFDEDSQKYQNAINVELDTSLKSEAQARTENDALLNQAIAAEKDRAIAAEEANAAAIEAEAEKLSKLESKTYKQWIYDVSAHNNGAIFESLSALLNNANLSTLIPTSVRCGGMSIRFIQGSEPNSDNKYVQYRLMSDTFNITPANWQGVDDVPTAGSDNLVKSGGVANKLAELEGKVGDYIDKGTIYCLNYIDPRWSSATGRTAVFYDISELDKSLAFTIELTDLIIPTANKIRISVLKNNYPYYSSGNELKCIYSGTNKFEGEIVIDSDIASEAKYIGVYQEDAAPENLCTFKVKLYSNTMSLPSAYEIAKKINSTSICNTSSINWEVGSLNESDGVVTEVGGNRLRSGFINVSSSFVYKAKDGYTVVAFQFDKDRKFLSRDTEWKSSTQFDASAKYARLLLRKDDDSTISPEEGINGFIEILNLANASLILNQEIKDNERDIVGIYDRGTTYVNKYIDPRWGTSTGRTGAFYKIKNKAKQHYIKVSDIVLPKNNKIIIAISTYPSTYDSLVVKRIAEIDCDNQEYEGVFNIEPSADYISIYQYIADEAACSFKVSLSTADSIGENDIKIQNIEAKTGISKDVIQYNSKIFLDLKSKFIRIYNPYINGGSNQYTGQLHCHIWDWENDAKKYRCTSQQMVDSHHDAGYDFMTITDYQYGNDVTEKPDNMHDMIWLFTSYEHGMSTPGGTGWDTQHTGIEQDQGQHIVMLNTDKVLNLGNETPGYLPKDAIEVAVANGIIADYAHPFLNDLFQSPKQIGAISKDCKFIEVYNGYAAIYDNTTRPNPCIREGVAFDYGLDILLSNGNNTFGIAVSDAHGHTGKQIKEGCIKVFANNKTREDILDSMLSGNFYCSTNVDDSLDTVSVKNGKFSVNVGKDALVEFIGKNAKVLKSVSTSTSNPMAEYSFSGDELYVRARITLNTNNPSLQDYHIMWTQAILVSNKLF